MHCGRYARRVIETIPRFLSEDCGAGLTASVRRSLLRQDDDDDFSEAGSTVTMAAGMGSTDAVQLEYPTIDDTSKRLPFETRNGSSPILL